MLRAIGRIKERSPWGEPDEATNRNSARRPSDADEVIE
jgi:hypothetical protein